MATAENVKRTTQGKLAAATQIQSADYLKPLFKLLRSRVRLVLRFYVMSAYLCITVTSCRCAGANSRDRALHAEASVPEG